MEFPINFGVIGLKSPSFSIAHEPPRFHYLVPQTQFPFFRCCGRSKGKRDEGRKKKNEGEEEGVGRRGKSRPLGMRNCETRIRETSVKRLRFQALTRDFARESLYNSAFARTRDAPRLTSWGKWHEREQGPYCAQGKPTNVHTTHNACTHSRFLSLHEIQLASIKDRLRAKQTSSSS